MLGVFELGPPPRSSCLQLLSTQPIHSTTSLIIATKSTPQPKYLLITTVRDSGNRKRFEEYIPEDKASISGIHLNFTATSLSINQHDSKYVKFNQLLAFTVKFGVFNHIHVITHHIASSIINVNGAAAVSTTPQPGSSVLHPRGAVVFPHGVQDAWWDWGARLNKGNEGFMERIYGRSMGR